MTVFGFVWEEYEEKVESHLTRLLFVALFFENLPLNEIA